MHLTMKHIWVWSESFPRNQTPKQQNHFFRPFVECNHEQKTEDLLLWKQMCSTVVWILGIKNVESRSWKSIKKFGEVCMWKSVSQLTQEQLRYLTCSVRPDIILNFHFLKAFKNYNSNNSSQTKLKKILKNKTTFRAFFF